MAKRDKTTGMNAQQKIFADEYLVNGYNAYRAAIKAGYSESYAKSLSYLILENTGVKAYIDKILQAKAISPAEALAITADIAKGKENAEGKTPSDNTRLKALDMILRANGQYTDKVEVSGNVDVASILKQAKARADKAKKSTE